MQTIFVMVKCELGKAYDVADDACNVDQVSEVYSTSVPTKPRTLQVALYELECLALDTQQSMLAWISLALSLPLEVVRLACGRDHRRPTLGHWATGGILPTQT